MENELPLNDERLKPAEPGSALQTRQDVRRFKTLCLKHNGLTTVWFAQIALGVSRQRIHQLIAEGRLPSYKLLGKVLIPCDRLDEFTALDRTTAFRYGYSNA